jgi:hypothetical protein
MLVGSTGTRLVAMIDYRSVPAKEPVRCCNRHRMRPGRGTAESSAGALMFRGHHLTDAKGQFILERSFLKTETAGKGPRVLGS